MSTNTAKENITEAKYTFLATCALYGLILDGNEESMKYSDIIINITGDEINTSHENYSTWIGRSIHVIREFEKETLSSIVKFSFYQMLIITYETIKKNDDLYKKANGHDNFKFLRHIRNALVHDRKWNITKKTNTIKWKGYEINETMNGNPYNDFLTISDGLDLCDELLTAIFENDPSKNKKITEREIDIVKKVKVEENIKSLGPIVSNVILKVEKNL